MKIEIEWNCSYSASLKIDGKELRVELKPGECKLVGLVRNENTNTFGGIIARELYSKIGDFMQAECIAYEALVLDEGLTWAHLPDGVADDVEDRAS